MMTKRTKYFECIVPAKLSISIAAFDREDAMELLDDKLAELDIPFTVDYDYFDIEIEDYANDDDEW